MQYSHQFTIGRNLFQEQELQVNQLSAIEEMKKIINRILERNKEGSTTIMSSWWYEQADRPTQVCSIFGERGEGKTATLVSLCSMLANENPNPYLIAPLLEPELIDPESDMFSVIAHLLIATLFQKSDNNDTNEQFQEKYKLEKRLTSLIEDAISRSERGKEIIADSSIDLESYVSHVTEKSTSFISNRTRLMIWIDELLNYHKKEILIFPIDDVDICREQSEKILEAVRLYLSHPNIVVILTADLETIRRAIRNRLLSNLPQVFTGGESNVPEKEGESPDGFFFSGQAKAQLLGQEYLLDDEYAQQFLYKVCPPAYRVYLSGLPAIQRQKAEFILSDNRLDILNRQGVSLEKIWGDIPLAFDVLSAFNDETHPCHGENIRKTLDNLLENNTCNGTLRKLFSWYPDIFPPTLRALINQINYFSSLAEKWRHNLKTIDKDSSENLFTVDRDPSWSEQTTNLDQLSETNKMELNRIINIEEEMMTKLVLGLNFNPKIEMDHNLFFSETHQLNAFHVNRISDFYALTTNISTNSSASDGFNFTFFSFDRSKRIDLSDQSSALINLIIEYISLRKKSIWPVLEDWQIDLNLFTGFNIKKIGFLKLIWSKPLQSNKNKKNFTDLSRLLIENLSSCFDIQISSRSENAFLAHFVPSFLGPPCMLSTIRKAALYFHYGLHSSVFENIKKMISNLNEQFDRIYEIDNEDKKNNKEETHQQIYDEVITQEINAAYRFLGIIGYRVWTELTGLYRVVTFPKQINNFRKTIRDDCHWLIVDVDSLGALICSVLADSPENSVEDCFLSLLYISSLPLSPLLTAWKQSDTIYENASSMIEVIVSLLEKIETKYASSESDETNKRLALFIDYSNIIRPKSSSTNFVWFKKDPKKPAIQISDFDNLTRSNYIASLSTEAPECNLRSQAERLNNFIELLLELQNYPLESKEAHYASSTQEPKAWNNLLLDCQFNDFVKDMLVDLENKRSPS